LYLVSHDAPGSDDYRFTRDLSGQGLWVEVEGGGLPMPIGIQVHRDPAGRYVFTGVRIGGESFEEITSQTLRQIKLTEILAAYYEYYEPIFEIEATLAEASRPLGRLRPRGPDDASLRAFARSYQIELARQPRRAMSAAAKAHSISRATANRWAATCRQLGYLPHVPPGEESS
jgi:hypothetical protein